MGLEDYLFVVHNRLEGPTFVAFVHKTCSNIEGKIVLAFGNVTSMSHCYSFVIVEYHGWQQ